jgi:transcriptional regulator with XRE-family HTH domain
MNHGRFGQFLRDLRQSQELSVERLASMVGMAPSTIYHWERGDFHPRLPELRAILAALEVPEATQRQVLTMLGTPRALVFLRETVRQADEVNGSGLDGMPAAGDLLRALRCRKRLAGKQVAEHLGVNPSIVTRWEQSRAVPSAEIQQDLLNLLDAQPEERAALTRSLFLSAPLEASVQTLDACERTLHLYRASVEAHKGFPGDLCFLALEARLWTLAAPWDKKVPLLVRCWLAHAEWLLWQGRTAEMGAYARRTQEALYNQTEPELFWAGSLAAERVARGPGNAAKCRARALSLLRTWTDFPFSGDQETSLYRGMAEQAGYAGELELAQRFLAKSRTLADRQCDPCGIKLADIIEARLLLLGRQAEKAVTLLQGHTSSDPCQRLFVLLLIAEAWLALERRSEAAQGLHAFYAYVDAHDLGSHRWQGNAIAYQL